MTLKQMLLVALMMLFTSLGVISYLSSPTDWIGVGLSAAFWIGHYLGLAATANR